MGVKRDRLGGGPDTEMVVDQLELTTAKAVTTPGVKDDSKCCRKEERRVNFADVNDPACNVIVEETLDSGEVVSLHG